MSNLLKRFFLIVLTAILPVVVGLWCLFYGEAALFSDWVKQSEFKHNLTLSDRRALVSEYIRSTKKISEYSRKVYPYEYSDAPLDSTFVNSASAHFDLVIMKRLNLTDSLTSVLKFCLFSKFNINDSLFHLISAEYTETITAELEELEQKQALQKGKKSELSSENTAAWFYWNYSDFKEPVCFPFLK